MLQPFIEPHFDLVHHDLRTFFILLHVLLRYTSLFFFFFPPLLVTRKLLHLLTPSLVSHAGGNQTPGPSAALCLSMSKAARISSAVLIG